MVQINRINTLIQITPPGEVIFVDYKDYRRIEVTRSLEGEGATSGFIIELDSPYGRHKSDFTVGSDVRILADNQIPLDDVGESDLIFRGILEEIEFAGEGLNERVILTGRSYVARLMDTTIQPITYTNQSIQTILEDIFTDYIPDVTVDTVGITPTIIPRISFNQNTVYEAVRQLALMTDSIWWIDKDLQLNFFLKADYGFSGGDEPTFDNTNIVKSEAITTRNKIFNRVWVYGDRYLAGFKEILSVGSPSVGGNLGSVFTLLHKPHNIEPDILGSVRLGGIFNLNVNTPSGTTWLVNFDDRQLIFPSGTTYGYWLPPSGGSIVSYYDREVPIVKFGEDRSSISAYGPRTTVINDKSIKDPVTASLIMKKELQNSQPFREISVNLKYWRTPNLPVSIIHNFYFDLGKLVYVNIPDFNINTELRRVVEMKYVFDKDTVHNGSVISLRLERQTTNFSDEIIELKRRLSKLEGEDRKDTDVVTRLEYATGSCLIVGSYWEIRTQYNGSEFRVWPSSNVPPLGSNFTPRVGLLSVGGSVDCTITRPIPWDSSVGGQTTKYGIQVTMGTETQYQLKTITKKTDCTATTVYFQNSDGTTTYSTTSFSGDIATFTTNNIMSGATVYRIVSDAEGAGYTVTYTSTPSMPFNSSPTGVECTNLIWNGAVNNDNWPNFENVVITKAISSGLGIGSISYLASGTVGTGFAVLRSGGYY